MNPIRTPWDAPPEFGETIEIADGVLWLRMPLPMALDHVNIYLLDDGDGWTVIDTGVASKKSREIWESVFAGPLKGKPVHRVVMTHHHPDHIGLNAWFMDRFDAEHLATRVAWLTGRVLALDVQEKYSDSQICFYQRAGMRADLLDARRSDRPFNFADIVMPYPQGFTRLQQDDVITMGGRRWQVHIGHGHAPEHATFWSMDDHLVLSGDQILQRISPNIGVYPTEPDADPLGEWIETCQRLAPLATEDHLVLGGHKLPFTGLPKRMQQLEDNHHSALSRLRRALAQPHAAGEVFKPIFKREISGGEYSLALVEALAHCNHLWKLCEASRYLDDDGIYKFVMRDVG